MPSIRPAQLVGQIAAAIKVIVQLQRLSDGKRKVTSIAEITLACDPIFIGDVLRPFQPIPVPLVIDPDTTDRCDVANGKPLGHVTYNRDDVIDAGTNWLVFLDLGMEDGVYPGTFVTVYRDNPVEGMPRLVMGEAGVLRADETYSTAIITRAWAPLGVGDRIEVK